MLTFEQIQSLELEQQKLQGNVLEKDSQRFGEKFTPTAAIHEHVDEKMAAIHEHVDEKMAAC